MDSFSPSLAKLEFDKIQSKINAYTTSDLGRNLIQTILPSTDQEFVQSELSRVSEFKSLLELDDPLSIEGIKDIRTSLQKSGIEGSYLTPQELRHILSTQRASRLIKSHFAKRKEKYPLLSNLVQNIYVDKVLEYNIEQAIDEQGKVKDSASKALRDIREAIIGKTEVLREKLESILKTVTADGFAQEEIITTRDGRMVIPVKVEHKHHVPGFIHSSSASGATVFIEPAETLEMNNEIRSLQFDEQREVERILHELTVQLRAVREHLFGNVDILAQIDFLYAKAKYSIEILGSQPHLTTEQTVRIIDARHPILLQKHPRNEVIPLSLELGVEYRTLLITGPNAGGKSVALKTVGLLSLMVQCGIHVPVLSESEFPIFEHIFVDIGDEQSIENDLSTFTSHLVNLKSILERANEKSLVLIDEIGAGTDPAEGEALAAAMLLDLTHRGALTIATTHHGALKAFAHETPGVENGAMEFDQAFLRPTYRFKSRVPGSSYALEIAGRLGMPESLIKKSKDFLGTQQDTLENLLADLEARSQHLQKELLESNLQKKRLDELVNLYEKKVKEIQKEIKEMKLSALQEAKDIVQKANALVESTIQEIRQKAAERTVIRKVKTDLDQFTKELFSQEEQLRSAEKENQELTEIHAGDLVKIKGGSEIGEILSAADEAGNLLVLFGSLKMKIHRKELVRIDGVQRRKVANSEITMRERKDIKTEIDLRGMMGDEAIAVVDKFLDDAFLAGLHRVDIIHGKGTGALRKKITEFIKSHPRVKSHRLGEWNEGGAGVTVVELSDS